MRLGLKKVDEKLQPSAGILTYAIGPRTLLLQKSPAEREASYEAIPDPVKREVRRSVVENGIKAPQFNAALARVYRVRGCAGSATREWSLAGRLRVFPSRISAPLPYIIRMNDLAMSPTFGPRLNDWFARVQARPTFETAVTKWVPAPMIQLLQNNGKEVWPDVEKAVREIRA